MYNLLQKRTHYSQSKYKRDFIPVKLRYKILVRDNFKCKLCGRNSKECILHIDHIHPISKGGNGIDEDNLRALCSLCNLGKSNVIEQRKEIETPPQNIMGGYEKNE